MNTKEALIGPRDVAELFGVPLSWVYVKSESGELPSFRLGKYRRFKASEVSAWLEQRREPAAAGR